MLQFVPQCIISQSIQQEKENYKFFYEKVYCLQLPFRSSIISSHNFLQVKKNGTDDKLKLKTWLVPYGNRDKEKGTIRKDSAITQVCVIRIVLSILSIVDFSVATVYVKHAYFRDKNLLTDIYKKPSKDWTASPFIV